MTSLYLSLFGGVRLTSGGHPVHGRAAHRRRLGLLALLAASPGQRASRERIVGLLWPESSPDAARKLLSESLYVIRRELGEDVIVAHADDLLLNDTLLSSDVAEFRTALAGDDLRHAASLYVGPFMDAWYVEDAPEFERWVDAQRDELRRAYLDCMTRIAGDAERAGDWTSATGCWRALAQADPYSSRFALRLAQAQASVGEPAAALQSLTAHETLLREEMQIRPGDDVVTFMRDLRSTVDVVPAQARFAAQPMVASHALPPSVPPAASATRALLVSTGRLWRPTAIAVALAIIVVVAAATRGSLWRGRPSVAELQFDPNDVAVRPFHDLTNRNAALAYALTDELILRLTGVAPVRVAARSAVVGLADSTIGLDSLARALRVGTVIEGTIAESDGKLSVIALITDVASGRTTGVAEVKGDTGRYSAVLDDIAASVERAFHGQLRESFRMRELTRGTRSDEAIRYAAEGQRAIDLARQTGREWRADAVDVSRGYLRVADSALSLAERVDPGWAQPLVKRALVASLRASSEPPQSASATLRQGIALANRALTLDPSNAAAFELRGTLHRQRYLTYVTRDTAGTDLRAAIADFESAKSRDSLRVGAWIGRAFLAWYTKDTVAARTNLEGASRLDAYLDGETDILLSKFLVALWLRDWNAAASACHTGRRQDPWNYRFVQCELTLARHDVARRPDPVWAWALVDTLSRMHPAEKAALAGRAYVPLYWRALAATISARAGRKRVARAAMDSVIADAARAAVLDDLAPDRAYFEWEMGDTTLARAILANFLRARPQQRASVEADALLGPIITATAGVTAREPEPTWRRTSSLRPIPRL